MSKKEEKAREYADNEVKRYHEHSGVIEKYGMERARMLSEHEAFELEEAYEAGWDDALKSQWVDVKGRLPKEWEDVIILFIKDGHSKVIKALYIGDERWVYGDVSVKRNMGVIAWMPIPSFEDILQANKDVLKRLKDK